MLRFSVGFIHFFLSVKIWFTCAENENVGIKTSVKLTQQKHDFTHSGCKQTTIAPATKCPVDLQQDRENLKYLRMCSFIFTFDSGSQVLKFQKLWEQTHCNILTTSDETRSGPWTNYGAFLLGIWLESAIKNTAQA